MAEVGNPSSIHSEGRRARGRVERARGQIAALVGRPPGHIVFTSGGTEANWLGVMALAAEVERRGRPRVVATSANAHPSLTGAVAALVARGWEVTGNEGAASLVAVSLVNHETGGELRLGPIPDDALVHYDLVQAAGKLDLDGLRGDSLAVSAHKLGGPAGVGALAIAPGCDGALPVAFAGHQERGRRPGSENLVGIVGFGAAAAAAEVGGWDAVARLAADLERGIQARVADVRVHAESHRVGGTVNLGFVGALGQDIVIALDLAGVAVSTGAACTSGTVQPSPVLLALGYTPEQAREAVRFSLGRATTAAEVDEVLELLPPIVERARRHR